MKKIEYCLNTIHYCFYKAHYKLHILLTKINPFLLLADIPVVKKRLKKKGVVDIRKDFDELIGNKIYGMSITVAGGALVIIFFLFFWGSVNLIAGAPRSFISLTTPHILISVILSVVLSYFFVFKQDKYLIYFDKFEDWSKSDKIKYSLISISFVFFVFCFLIFSII